MKTKKYSRLMGVGLCVLAVQAIVVSTKLLSAPRPNIVFILSDDQGWADVGFHGGDIRTPNIDKLAAAGVQLDQFYVQPLCSPTRACFLTGRYPIRYGLQIGVVRPHARYGLPLSERTIAQALRQSGYETAITGKWHLGFFERAYLPTQRGFDHQYGLYNGNFDYFTHLRDGGLDWHRDDRALREEGYSTTLITREAVRLISTHKPEKPLFLYVAYNAVHGPFQVPERYAEPYSRMEGRRRTYAGMVAAMDDGIGEIVAALDKAGLRQNTLIVFCSDNGGPLPGVVTSNGPLREGKGSLYEGGVRVPAIAVWDGKIKAGSVVREPLHMVDWYPTLVKLAGGAVEQPLALDGKDAWATITKGAASPHDEILNNISIAGGAIRVGDWKLVVNGHIRDGEEGGQENAARREAKREALAAPVIELFNLKDDPYEKMNLAESNPQKVRELRTRLDVYAKEAAPSLQAPAAPGFKVPAIWGEP